MRAQGGVVLLVCGLPLAAGRAAQIGEVASAALVGEPTRSDWWGLTGATNHNLQGRLLVPSSSRGPYVHSALRVRLARHPARR
jgi:hypothetical protein